MTPSDPAARPLSEVVRDLAQAAGETISLGEVVEAFGPSALAGLLLIFGLACALPLPPGSTAVFGAPLLLLAPQLLLDSPAPWLPRRLRERRISTAELRGALGRMTPWLERLEAVTRPRLGLVVGRVGRRLIGLICTAFAVVLILPVPLGNILPGVTVTIFAAAMIQRDGAVALAGYVFTAASVGAMMLAANAIGAAVRAVAAVLGVA